MAIVAERIIAARNAKGWSQADLASRIDVTQQTIGKLETGQARTSKHLPRIAAALGVDLGHLDPDYNHSQMVNVAPATSFAQGRGTMPLHASAEASGKLGELIISAEPVDYVPRPPILDNVKDAYAIIIEGDSMEPAFEAGDEAWVNPMLGPRRNVDVVLYQDDSRGNRRAIVRRLVTWTDTDWTLRQYNPRQDFTLPRDPWGVCHRVIGKLSKRG